MIHNFKFKFLLVVGSIFSIFISCKKDKNQDDKFELNKIEEVKITIDNTTSTENNSYHFSNDSGKDYLYLLNRNKQLIQIYDWNTKLLVNKIKLEVEGPNGVGTPTGIYADKMDSIFIVSGYNYSLSIIDSLGRIKKKIRLLKDHITLDKSTMTPPTGGYSSLILGDNQNSIFKKNQFIICGATPLLNPSEGVFYEQGKSAVIIDTKKDTLDYIIPYPKSYLTNFQKNNRFPDQFAKGYTCFNKDKNLCVVSFPAEEKVSTLNLDNLESTTKNAPSRFFQEINPLSSHSNDPQLHFNHAIKNDHYGEIKYDPYTKRYLRFSYHPNSKKEIGSLDKNPWVLTSIIILDDNFNRLGESMLDITTNGYTFFTRDGMYIYSFNNDSEDEIIFHHYKIVEL